MFAKTQLRYGSLKCLNMKRLMSEEKLQKFVSWLPLRTLETNEI